MSYYNINFQLMTEHNYSLSEIDNLIPWEKEVYVELLIEHIKNKNEEAKRRNS